MDVRLEFLLRLDDVRVEGTFEMPLMHLPPLGSLFFMHGVRFNVSDVITTVSVGVTQLSIECSAVFKNDGAFMAALATLAREHVSFDAETMELLEG